MSTNPPAGTVVTTSPATTPAASNGFLGTLQASAQNFAADALGLGFGGAAIYGVVTGHVPGALLTTALALSAFYLGIKVPTAAATVTTDTTP